VSQLSLLDTGIEQELEALQAELNAAIANVDRLREAIRTRAAEAARVRREMGEREAERIRATANGEADLLEARAHNILDTLAIEPEPALTVEDVLAPAADPSPVPRPARRRAPAAGPPLLVPVLGFRQELILRALVLLGVTAIFWFWTWWLGEGHGVWTAPSVMVTVLFAWVSIMSAYFFFFVARMTRPNPALPIPRMRVAMIVTKAPSEPWSVLVPTIEAMLHQDFPYPYDVWLADERPSEETLRWCLENNVAVSTRFGVDEYHRSTWPRRTKCKEGNLSWFYDCVGYNNYDVVAQLDADHVPAPTYLAEIVRPFRDPGVGYVAAPSVCDANANTGWTVRGRLHRESTLHGPVQAGSNQGYGPVCIGSHYAVRTRALREVGGLGPELAEDYTTTLWLQSAGWDGVFAIDAEAHGDGPESLAEMLTQEIQWARSLGTVLTRYAPSKLRTVPLKARLRLGFAIFFYPLQGVALALAALLPAIGVIFGLSWGNTSLAGFYAHLWPLSLVGMAITGYLRRQQVLRPRDAKLWSWEMLLFQMIRWPWTMVGAFQGMWVGFRRQDRTFKVTPKGEKGTKPLPLAFVLPSLLLGVFPALVTVTMMNWGRAPGLVLLASGQAFIYLGAVLVGVAFHVASNARAVATATAAPLTWQGLVGVTTSRTVMVTLAVALPTIAALLLKFAAAL
jgi:cellulose synthase/poly-beta-1,6-N-acetylglucosamine synthase-like glycosyltransferase